MTELVYIGLVVSLGSIVSYWLFFFLAIRKYHFTSPPKNQILPPVSVIVCYKNAEKSIRLVLEKLSKQQYPNFEIIAINDFSTDNSQLEALKITDHCVHLNANKDRPGKKSALTEAILHAQHNILLFTDADCMPVSSRWISGMASKMIEKPKTAIVLGYGPTTPSKEMINIFARYETLLTAIQYISYAIWGKPYMGVGRNLMYRKSLFLQHNGFENHLDIASGDDDLFIHEVANKENIAIQLSPETFVYSPSKVGMMDFLRQKTRHTSTSLHYSILLKCALGYFASCQLLFYATLIIGYFCGIWSGWTIAVLCIIKWTIQMYAQDRFVALLQEKDLRWYFPFLDISMQLYYLVLPCLGIFYKNKW